MPAVTCVCVCTVCVCVCVFSIICRWGLYLLSWWAQIKAFHSNSLSGNRGSSDFIYKRSGSVTAGTKWFMEVWSERRNMSFSTDVPAACRTSSVDSVTTCHSRAACCTCHIWHDLACMLYVYTRPHLASRKAVSSNWRVACNVLLGIMVKWRTHL